MSQQLAEFLEAAMKLSVNERAEAAAKLLDSLEEQDDELDAAAVDGAWAEEAERRWQSYKRGEMKSVPIEEIFDLLKQRTKP